MDTSRPGGAPPSRAGGAVVIPGMITEFLDRATVGIAGTRDKNKVPHVHRTSGWRLSQDRRTMAFLVSGVFTDHLVSSLEDNGHIALTVLEAGTHETYQFKGRYLASRPCSDDDMHLFRQIRDRFTRVVSTRFGVPEAVCRRFVAQPELTISFEVHEIYLQTPGPGAGRRLTPPENVGATR